MPSLVLLCALIVAGADGAAPFRAVEIDSRFEGYLRANPLLMEVPGAKVIRLDNGNQVVLAVASTVLQDDSADERLRAEKVCKIKALASVVAEKQGVQLAHVEQVKEKTVVVIENGKESGQTVTEVLEVTKARVQGIAQEMPVVGRWKSGDGKVFFLAIGAMCDRTGISWWRRKNLGDSSGPTAVFPRAWRRLPHAREGLCLSHPGKGRLASTPIRDCETRIRPGSYRGSPGGRKLPRSVAALCSCAENQFRGNCSVKG
jgi:hypothetical protein